MEHNSILARMVEQSMPLTIKAHYERRGTFQNITFFGAGDVKIVVERGDIADEWQWLPNPFKGQRRADQSIDVRAFKWIMTVEADLLEEEAEEKVSTP